MIEQPKLPYFIKDRRFLSSPCVIVLLATIGGWANADTITDIDFPGAVVSEEDARRISLNTAKHALQQEGFEKCRELLATARETNPDLPHSDVLAAQWFFEFGQQANATRLMEQLAVAEPDRIDVRLLFAKVALQQGRLFDAWTHAAAVSTSSMPEAWSEPFRQAYRTDLLRTQAAVASRRTDWVSAKSLFEQLVTESASPGDQLGLANAEFFLGNVATAEPLIRKACESDEVTAIPELVLASLAEQNQQPKDCEEWFRKGIELEQSAGSSVRLEYARWLIRNNRPADAKESLAPGKPTEEQSADYAYVRGLAERMAGEIAAAEAVFTELHQADPASFPISNQLALVLIESTDEGKRGRALQIATANARRFPKHADALSTLGWIQFRLGDPVQAEKILTAAISGGQASRDTAFFVSKVKASLGKTKEANDFAAACENGSGEFFSQGTSK